MCVVAMPKISPVSHLFFLILSHHYIPASDCLYLDLPFLRQAVFLSDSFFFVVADLPQSSTISTLTIRAVKISFARLNTEHVLTA